MDPKAVSDTLPKKFEGSTEILPLTKHGLASFDEFKRSEEESQHITWLKRIGLSKEEIELYQESETGVVDKRQMESSVLKDKLEAIYTKINNYIDNEERTTAVEQPSTSSDSLTEIILDTLQKKPLKFYPEGHPMDTIQNLEEDLFGHLKAEEIMPVDKRRKILRHLERRKERIAQSKEICFPLVDTKHEFRKPGSLWDVKELPAKQKPVEDKSAQKDKIIIGPKKQTMYTVKDNKIMRLEPVADENKNGDDYQAVDIVLPVNAAEERLLEGTKMTLEDIKKIDRFKDYQPGTPSKVLYLKNIAPGVTAEQLTLLFNQFIQENGGPIDVRLLAGRMRGQAFATFQNESTCIRALEEINGTIMSGRPIVAQFGRNSNRIQDDER